MFKFPDFENFGFRKFQNFQILGFHIFKISFKKFQLWAKKWKFSNYNHRKRRGTVRGTYPKMIQSNFQVKRSILKIGHFWGFSKFSVPDPDLAQSGDPRMICSSMASWSSRRPERPRGAAPAVPDDQTHVPTCPQCSLMITQWSGGAYGGPGGPYPPQLSKCPFLHYLTINPSWGNWG